MMAFYHHCGQALGGSGPTGNQKIREYLAIGVVQVWVADPEGRTISVHRSPTDVKEFGDADRLPGGELLVGFETAIAGPFEE